MHQQTKTVTATDQCQRRFRRAEKHDAGDLRSRGSQSTRMGFRLRARIGGDDDRSETAEGRQNGLFPLDDLPFIKAEASPETIACITGCCGW